MATTSQSTATKDKGDSRELTGNEGLSTSPILELGGNAKEFGGLENAQVDCDSLAQLGNNIMGMLSGQSYRIAREILEDCLFRLQTNSVVKQL